MASNGLNVIGYEQERTRLEASIKSGVKFVLIEGALGAGKTTLIKESMTKHGGVRIIAGDRTHFIEAIETELDNGLASKLSRKILGTKTNPVTFLEKYGRPLVLYFDENRGVEEIALDVKNAVTDNNNLQAVFALTPEQKVRLFTSYPEFANRFNATAHITLKGLDNQAATEFVAQNASIPFDDEATEFVTQKRFPQEILDEIRSLEVLARENESSKVTGDLLKEYKPVIQVYQPDGSQKIAVGTTSDQILEVVMQNAAKGGLEPIEIARLINKDAATVRVRLVDLKKRSLITKIGKKIVPFHAPNQAGIGP